MSTQAVVPAAEPAVESKEQERIPEPCVVVIFGASGDLTKRKLLPALFHLEQQDLLPKDFAVVGVARRDISATFAADMQDGIVKGGGVDAGDSKLKPFIDRVKYFATEFDSDEGFDGLKTFLEGIDKQFGTKGNRLFYLAVAPEFFADITERLGKHGMTQESDGKFVHVIIEKPFGTDLESAKKLNDEINAVLSEDQIFSASTTTSARRRYRTFSSSALAMGSSSPCGTGITSTTLRSRRRSLSASKGADRSMRRPERCATCCRTM